MRVVCINNKPKPGTTGDADKYLEIGKEYEVYQSPVFADAYRVVGLINIRPDRKSSFVKEYFAPLSEIDERDLAHAEPIESTYKLREV